MSSSESDYKPNSDQSESSPEIQSRPNSRRASHNSASPRKRSRTNQSESPGCNTAAKKYHLGGHFYDGYRELFNQDVNSAVERFTHDTTLCLHNQQIGVSKWSSKEKCIFFAALDRLGRDDICGLAQAVGTKTISEVKEFLNILEDASKEHETSKLTLWDVPAAIEIGHECVQRLDLAGEALAWHQEKFEAKQEQARFGEYWLITPEVAQQVDEALQPSRQSSFSSMSPAVDEDPADQPFDMADDAIPAILQHVPEANLLDISKLLELSSSVFMNSAPDLPSAPPHWKSLVSTLASSPSIYRTALMDFHTLVVSLTRRLTQATIIQATSRIRSRGHPSRDVQNLVHRRDALSAIDMLRLPRNGKARWRGVARRCHLHVVAVKSADRKELTWDEVETSMEITQKASDSATSGTEATEPDFGGDDSDFKIRASRGGTPRPPRLPKDSDHDSTTDENSEISSDGEASDFEVPMSPIDQQGSIKVAAQSGKYELKTIEEFDKEASRQEESRLWGILGRDASINAPDILSGDEDTEGLGIEAEHSDWREWTEYRAEWETLQTPVPAAAFKANEKPPSPSPALPLHAQAGLASGLDTDGRENDENRPIKRRRTAGAEIQVQGVHSYALSQAAYLDPASEVSEDDAKYPAQSIEQDDIITPDHETDEESSGCDME